MANFSPPSLGRQHSQLSRRQRQRSESPPASTEFTIFTSIRCDPILSSSHDNEDFSSSRKCNLYMPELHRQRLKEAASEFWPESKFPELESTESFQTALSSALEERERLHETYMCPMKVKYSFTSTGRTTMELSPIPALSLEALFPSTFRLPSSRHSPSSRGSRFGSDSPSHSPRYSPPTPSSRPGSSEDYFSTSSGDSSHRSSARRLRSELPATYEIWIDTLPTKQDGQHTSFKTSYRPAYTQARSRTLPDCEDYTQEVLLWNSAGLITEGSVLTPYFYRGGRWVTPCVTSEGHGGQRGTSRRWAIERGLCVEGAVERRSVRVGEKVWLSNGVRGFGWGKIMPARGGESSSENSV